MTSSPRLLHRVRRRMQRLRPRRFHAYCVGAAKTGTTSVATAFQGAYRARHEPEAQATNRLVIDYLEGTLDRDALRAQLLARDRRLRLEMESAHPLGYLAGVLAEAFPRARFVVTMREPLSWLRSVLNFHHRARPEAWGEYQDYFYRGRHTGYAPEEEPLRRYDLCSLDTYLSLYADHYRRVLREVPPERRLLIRTAEIDRRLEEVGRFVGAQRGTLVVAHSKRSLTKIAPLDEMDQVFVRDRIHHHCADLLTYFPDRATPYAQR